MLSLKTRSREPKDRFYRYSQQTALLKEISGLGHGKLNNRQKFAALAFHYDLGYLYKETLMVTTRFPLYAIPGSPEASCVVTAGKSGLLLVPGTASTVESNFSRLLPHLTKDYEVISANYPDSFTETLDPDTLAHRMIQIAEQAGFRRTFIFAFSLGCPLAIRCAALYPSRVRGLVLTSGFAYLDEDTRNHAGVIQHLAERQDLVEVARRLLERMISQDVLRQMSSDQFNNLITQMEKNFPVGTARQFELIQKVDVRHDLDNICVPTLLINPSDERLIGSQLGAVLSRIPGSRGVTLPCGHLPIDQIDEWLRVTKEFLQGTEAQWRPFQTEEGLAA